MMNAVQIRKAEQKLQRLSQNRERLMARAMTRIGRTSAGLGVLTAMCVFVLATWSRWPETIWRLPKPVVLAIAIGIPACLAAGLIFRLCYFLLNNLLLAVVNRLEVESELGELNRLEAEKPPVDPDSTQLITPAE